MAKIDKRIDAYIMKSAEFAQPILIHLRELIHHVCPDVEETMKWSMPHFDYHGEMMCGMAAFKQHCSFGFWKASLMKDKNKIFSAGEEGMGHLGKIKNLSDLPSDKILIAYIKEAAKLNKEGVKLPSRKKSTTAKELVVPDYFIKELKRNKKALNTFENFSYSHKKEYVEWIAEAKTEETRIKRMETAMDWMAEGKGRNWKYERK